MKRAARPREERMNMTLFTAAIALLVISTLVMLAKTEMTYEWLFGIAGAFGLLGVCAYQDTKNIFVSGLLGFLALAVFGIFCALCGGPGLEKLRKRWQRRRFKVLDGNSRKRAQNDSKPNLRLVG